MLCRLASSIQVMSSNKIDWRLQYTDKEIVLCDTSISMHMRYILFVEMR